MGNGNTMFSFKRNQNTHQDISQFWARFIIVVATTTCDLFQITNDLQDLALEFVKLPISEYFVRFVEGLFENQGVSLSTVWHELVVIRYLFLVHFQKDGGFSIPTTITKSFGQVEYTYNLILGMKLDQAPGDSDMLMKENADNFVFKHLITIHGQLRSLNNTSQNDSVVIVKTNSPDKIMISNIEVSFKDNIVGVIHAQYTKLYQMWPVIMKGVPLLEIPVNIKDDYNVLRPEYSFANDPKNKHFEFRASLSQHL